MARVAISLGDIVVEVEDDDLGSKVLGRRTLMLLAASVELLTDKKEDDG